MDSQLETSEHDVSSQIMVDTIALCMEHFWLFSTWNAHLNQFILGVLRECYHRKKTERSERIVASSQIIVHAIVLFMAVVDNGKFLFLAGSKYLHQVVYCGSLVNNIIENSVYYNQVKLGSIQCFVYSSGF